MAKPILVANWKNYPGSLLEAQTLLKELAKKRELYKKLFVFIAPPFVYLESVANRIKGFAQLGSQDISSLAKGTYTGEILPDILKSFGVRISIIGHSERRVLGETIIEIKEKIKVALRSGVTPLLCIGEQTRDTDGEHLELLRQELKICLSGLSKNEVAKIALAYEPVWAVGKNAQGVIEVSELAQTVVFLRKALADLFGRKAAESVPILYGGSVDPSNAQALMQGSGIRGFLVGRASLNTKSFEAIARALIAK